MTTANHPNRAPLTEDELLGDGTAEQIAALEAKYGGPEAFEPTGESQAPAPAPAPVAAAPAPADAPAPAAPAPGPAPAPAAAPTPAPSPVPASSAAPAADVDDGGVSGVATADGKRILPYGVLQEARRTASINRQRAEALDAENQELKQRLEALKSGHAPDSNGQFTDEQLAEIKADHPQLAPLLDTVKQLQETVAKAAPAPAPAANPEEVANHELTVAEQVDAAIADRPLLARYRDRGGVGWKRAAEIDDVLYADPKWKGRPLSERFAEVERQLAEELGVPIPSAAPTPAPPAPAPAPSAPAPAPAAPAPASIQAAQTPNTLSDMAGGTAPTDEITGLQQASGQDLVHKFAGMSDAQIEALLYRAV